MDDKTRRGLLSSVDAHGNPRWKPATVKDLARQSFEVPADVRDPARQGEGSARASAPGPSSRRVWIIAPSSPLARERVAARTVWMIVMACAVLLVLALTARLSFLYYGTDPSVLIPSWSNDTWHRWQIAYLSKEIGFSRGFLTLWDLKGLEYYWGILPPILVAGLFGLTGSVDVMILRWLTIGAGALDVVLLFLLGRKYWSTQVGMAAAFLAALNPILIFNDPSGMVEPISFFFLLAGIWLYPRRSALAGSLWALGAMTRAEAWLFSAGLLAAAMLGREPTERKISLGIGWGVPILAYMKYLVDKTGNPIYPIYWNFLANAAGRWEFREGFTDYQLAARPVFGAVLAVCLVGVAWALWKRPKAHLIYLLGFGATGFVAGFVGLTAYLKSYEPWFWMTRFFVFPYMLAGLQLAAFVLGWLPGRLRLWGKLGLGWLTVIATILALQLTWEPVFYDVDVGYTSRTNVETLRQQGEFVGATYQGGTVLIPEGTPQFTYALGRYSGIPGENLLGQMYGPIYYYQGDDPYQDWAAVGPQMWQWFERDHVTLLVMAPDDRRFLTMLAEHPERFEPLGTVPGSSLGLYGVVPWQ